MSERSRSHAAVRQSDLSIAVAFVFFGGTVFATLTATLFPPDRPWSWPNPFVVAAATLTVALVVLHRGRRLRRTSAAWACGLFAGFLVIASAAVDTLGRAMVAGVLIVSVILVFVWFMPPLLARVFGYTTLAVYGTVLIVCYPGNDTVLIAAAECAISVMVIEVFGRFKRELQRASLTDHLCRVWNRAGFDLQLQREVRSATRTGEPLSLLYLDLDGFKEVNDAEGHLAGDRVLEEVSRGLERSVRGSDSVARIGGDEFALILPRTTGDEARALGVRLRNEVTACGWTFGVAEHRADESVEHFVRRSDEEMLRRKRGRMRDGGAPPDTAEIGPTQA